MKKFVLVLIEEYFKECQNKYAKPLFYFSCEIYIQNGIKTLISNAFRTPDPSIVHLEYLYQFVNGQPSATEIATLWIDQEIKSLPLMFHHLRRVSWICFQLSYQGCFSRSSHLIELKYESPQEVILMPQISPLETNKRCVPIFWRNCRKSPNDSIYAPKDHQSSSL